MSNEFRYVSPGIEPELKSLTLDELKHHYCTMLNDFVLDEYLGTAYLNRFLSDSNFHKNANMSGLFAQLMNKIVQLLPFNSSVRSIYSKTFNSNKDQAIASMLGKMTISNDQMASIQNLVEKKAYDEAYSKVLKHLHKEKENIKVAEVLLDISLTYDFDPTQWMSTFKPHPLLKDDWYAHVIYKSCKQGAVELALKMWEAYHSETFYNKDILLNFAAVSFSKSGDAETARSLYMRSLALDPTQGAIQHLAREIDDPFALKKDILLNKKIPILIYSYNKAKLLKQTLSSVCMSDIGLFDIIVLLNGCTDNSLDIVEKAKQEYPHGSIEVLNIPINMGAPQGRNYLLHHIQRTREFEYVAYLDDDVVLPPHWLQAMLTAMEADPQVGVAGCQILTPGPPLQQYLYRDITIVKPGLFRLGWATPHCCRSVGMYDFRRDVDTVMGCCHLIRRECFNDTPSFDIQFSPSQLDDVSFHLDVGLNGWKVRYLGQLHCVHYRDTGFMGRKNRIQGNSMGNDVKFYYRFLDRHKDLFERMDARTSQFLYALNQKNST